MADIQLTPQQAQAVTNSGGSLLVSAAAARVNVIMRKSSIWQCSSVR